MTRPTHPTGDVHLTLTRSEALVLFEWLSRNFDEGHWEDKLMVDPAEKKVVYGVEADLEKVLTEPFDPDYANLVQRAYRDLVPNPTDWL